LSVSTVCQIVLDVVALCIAAEPVKRERGQFISLSVRLLRPLRGF